MKKEVRDVDKERGILQVTAFDERHYYFATQDATGNPTYEFEPSVTWILGRGYPKGTELTRWIAKNGWDEAEEIKMAAAERGNRVHHAIEMLLKGEPVTIEDKYPSILDDTPKELTTEEWEAILSFQRWYEATKPETLANEFVVRNKEVGYAGTVDYLCKIDGAVYLVDFKTSQSLHTEHELQVSAYNINMPLSRNRLRSRLRPPPSASVRRKNISR
jgi:ATP-dependent exoDNAse (exonuclease V) beta subunit